MRTEAEKMNKSQNNELNGINSFRIAPKEDSNNVEISHDFRKMEINIDVKILENESSRNELVEIILKHIKKRGYSIAVELTTSFLSDGGTKEYFVTLGREDLKGQPDVNITQILEKKLISLVEKAHKKFLKKSNLPVFS